MRTTIYETMARGSVSPRSKGSCFPARLGRRCHHKPPSADGDVFQTGDGQPVNPASFSKAFGRLVARSVLPRVRLHDLRHTYATSPHGSGLIPVLLSERLDHTSIAVTIDRYSHIIPSIDRNADVVVAQLTLSPN